MRMKRSRLLIGFFGFCAVGLAAAPQAELWPRWEAHNPESIAEIDHSEWGALLDEYLVSDRPSGVNRVRYGAVSAGDHRTLQNYLDMLQSTEVSDLNRDEQLAYWINLYNAATMNLIVENYPLDSIRDLGEGMFSQGAGTMRF